MKTILPYLGAFIAGVFVGAGLWIALIFSAAGLAAWWWGCSLPSPDRLKHLLRPHDEDH